MYYLVQHKVALRMLGGKAIRPKTYTLYAVSGRLAPIIRAQRELKIRTLKIVYFCEVGEERLGKDRIIEN